MSVHRHSTPPPPARRPGEPPSRRHSEPRPPFWRSKAGLVGVAFLAIGAFLILSEHRLHALGYLPFLLLLACPLMHIFMHGGHAGHGGHGDGGRSDRSTTPSEEA
jgi:hypothetical protein